MVLILPKIRLGCMAGPGSLEYLVHNATATDQT